MSDISRGKGNVRDEAREGGRAYSYVLGLVPASLWKVPGALAGNVSEKGLHSQRGDTQHEAGDEGLLDRRPGPSTSCGFAHWTLTFGTARARRHRTVVGAASRGLSPASCDGTLLSPQ